MTNATKAALIGFVNAALGAVTSFGVALSDAQQVSVVGLVNAALVLWVALTYKNSPKRVAEPGA